MQQLLAITLFLSLALATQAQTACSEQWQCSSLSADYNYVQCLNGVCSCRTSQGFQGAATAASMCDCIAPNTVQWINNIPMCGHGTPTPAPSGSAPSPSAPGSVNCTEQWECADVSADYNYVQCVDGVCSCRESQGFQGAATNNSVCDCIPPNIVQWINNVPMCGSGAPTPAPVPSGPSPSPPAPGSVNCTAQWECAPVSADYNYVQCVNGVCSCRASQGFQGAATESSVCDCIPPNTVQWINNIPMCGTSAPVPVPISPPSSAPVSPPVSSGAITCTAQWECASVSADYNYVQCVNNLCSCRLNQGFQGAATADSVCDCIPPNTVQWINNIPMCGHGTPTPAPSGSAPSPSAPGSVNCTEQWECASVSADYNYVQCVGGVCSCRGSQGFQGAATSNSVCDCIPPNIVQWINNVPMCGSGAPTPAPVPSGPAPSPPSSGSVNCTAQWECAPVSADYNYVQCLDGICSCRHDQGFQGAATADSVCDCVPPSIVQWTNGIPMCSSGGPTPVPISPPTSSPPTSSGSGSCTEQWECSNLSLDYNYVQCLNGVCACRVDQGFDGNATAESLCECILPKTVSWVGDVPHCS